MDKEFADKFAKHWIDSWNTHNLDEILTHYTDDFEISSPIVAERMGIPNGVLKGKALISEYWLQGLSAKPYLHFEFVSVLRGIGSLVINYQGRRGLSAEVFYFNAKGLVYKVTAHYE